MSAVRSPARVTQPPASRPGVLHLSGEPEGASHRERLIAAMAAAIEERGYRETTVADVVRIARTSRRSFYEHFEDRDGCFLALFDTANDALMDQIGDAVAPDRPWAEQVDQALTAYLEGMTARPVLFFSFARELPALGQAGATRQRAVIERFASLLVGLVESGRRHQPQMGARPLALDVAIMIVGGLRELVVIAAAEGRDVREVGPVASQTVKAIINDVLL